MFGYESHNKTRALGGFSAAAVSNEAGFLEGQGIMAVFTIGLDGVSYTLGRL